MGLSHKQKRQIIIALLILLAIVAGLYFDYHQKSNSRLTLYQQLGETAYKSLVKPEDRAPLPLPANILKKGRAIRLPILMYHHVGNIPPMADGVRRGLTVSPDNFEAQVSWLKKQGFTTVSLNDLYQLAQKQPVRWPKKPVIFSFDDGYSDVFENAVPILKQNGFSGVFAIITSYPGQTQGTNTYAAWQQIAAARDGGMEIICHTQNHFDGSNPKYSSEYIYENLSGCQQDIKNHLNDVESFMIYPYGHSTATYIAQAKKVGFVMGITVHEGSLINLDDLMHIPRVRVRAEESLEEFAKSIKE